MGNILAGNEIVELGIQIEKNGRDFYTALASRIKNKKVVEIFGYLASEEEKHIVVFQKILEGLSRNEPPESYPGEYLSYMTSLSGEYVFTQKDKGTEVATRVKDEKEAVNLGIGFEKDSIVFYEGMKGAVPEYDLKAVEELISQEQYHLKQLLELKRINL